MLRANAQLALDEHDRRLRTSFWAVVPESFVLALCAFHQAIFVLARLVVNEDKMARNLDSTKGLIVAEHIVTELAPSVRGKSVHDTFTRLAFVVLKRTARWQTYCWSLKLSPPI